MTTRLPTIRERERERETERVVEISKILTKLKNLLQMILDCKAFLA